MATLRQKKIKNTRVKLNFAGFGVYQKMRPTQCNQMIGILLKQRKVDEKLHHGTSLSEDKWHTDVIV